MSAIIRRFIKTLWLPVLGVATSMIALDKLNQAIGEELAYGIDTVTRANFSIFFFRDTFFLAYCTCFAFLLWRVYHLTFAILSPPPAKEKRVFIREYVRADGIHVREYTVPPLGIARLKHDDLHTRSQ